MFSSICLPSDSKLLLTPGIGMGMGGETNLGKFGKIVGPFKDQFTTILGPPMPKHFFQHKIDFLEMAHTSFASSIRKTRTCFRNSKQQKEIL